MSKRTLAALLDLFSKMLNSPRPAIDEREFSVILEGFATWLFSDCKSRWYDGAVEIEWRRRKSAQVIVSGQMWVGDDQSQWKEPFKLTLTDMRGTKQDIIAVMKIGEYENDAKLLFAFEDAKSIEGNES